MTSAELTEISNGFVEFVADSTEDEETLDDFADYISRSQLFVFSDYTKWTYNRYLEVWNQYV